MNHELSLRFLTRPCRDYCLVKSVAKRRELRGEVPFMAEVNLTQAEADALIAMPKARVNEDE